MLQSITELLETLDQKKDEAINFTFKQVAKYFSDIFKELVPMGRGDLVMLRNKARIVLSKKKKIFFFLCIKHFFLP